MYTYVLFLCVLQSVQTNGFVSNGHAPHAGDMDGTSFITARNVRACYMYIKHVHVHVQHVTDWFVQVLLFYVQGPQKYDPVMCASCATPVDSHSNASSQHNSQDERPPDYTNDETLPRREEPEEESAPLTSAQTASTIPSTSSARAAPSHSSNSSLRSHYNASPQTSPSNLKHTPALTSPAVVLPPRIASVTVRA